ncbi:hypothetical protein BTO14_00655 [Polaribacter butkevichii]|uniref:Uncharacterized protein n=2 Tax=Polaribacter butkevichii TaxID=218490 RepID=A0A2P6CAC8_9FLAO|nr:hypothetical protein BTO14_00655 [Polaribacter butkevichii]
MYLLLFLVLFSCGNDKKETTTTVQEKPKRSIVKQHVALVNVKSTYKKEVENWQELKSVNSFIKKFEKVSPNEALSNALELRDLVVSLKDSVKPTLFDNQPFETRINVLHNEVLRLADLTFIPAITSEEVNLQIDKTIAAFSSVNEKINSILAKKSFEDAIDIEIDYIGIDSTKIDSISKKSINLKRKENNLKKSELNSDLLHEIKPITRE